jgi:NhaA family Na+:H+ antiporter
MPELEAERAAGRLSADHEVTAGEVRDLAFELRESVSVAERLAESLHPWTSYVVIPIFALANAGIVLSSDALSDAASSSITLGVVAGLVVGKVVGISLFSWLAVRGGLARLPVGVRWAHVFGLAALAGIGFTVSIFVSGLAYTEAALQDEAKIGVLVASLLAAVIGTIALRRTAAEDP